MFINPTSEIESEILNRFAVMIILAQRQLVPIELLDHNVFNLIGIMQATNHRTRHTNSDIAIDRNSCT